jgi:hypothetical protein
MMEIEVPDLTQHLQLTDYVPVFSGTYSSVHKGTLHGQTVRNNSMSAGI